MTRIVNTQTADPPTDRRSRPYRSELREAQAGTTRGRILDAAMRVMARGIASVSIPEIAREAGVSVPTVYRHFGTKQDLLDAVYPHAERRAGLGELVLPRTMAEFRAGIRRFVERTDAFDDLTRAVMASPAAEQVRHASMPRRLEVMRTMVDAIAPGLPEDGRERIVRLFVILSSSGALRMWRDHLEVSPQQVATEIDRVVQAAIAAERQGTP